MPHKTATFDQRLLAQSIDITFVFPFLLLLDGVWATDSVWFWFVCIIIYHTYAVGMEITEGNATIGKKMAKVKVQMVDGSRVTFRIALERNTMKWLSLLPVSAGFFMIYFRRDGKSLHDLISKSTVIVTS